MTDARYPLADDCPVRLIATDQEDLNVISTLLQDSLFRSEDLAYMPERRELALLVNRYRWENETEPGQGGDQVERVRAVLQFRDVMQLDSNLETGRDRDVPYNLLTLGFETGADCTGIISIMLSGHWDVNVHVECINVTLTDVTMPYHAPSGQKPIHDI